ncbi:Protein-methionine-sulfoxide reductase catalytic subunit MsrP [archaeon HR01]|nr:Protein-methionine-sulfoxide reductase catalytic subunit MsrP [archaeon HR01]
MDHILERLPTFPASQPPASRWRLKICGQVLKTLELSLEEIMRFPPTSLTFDFRCLEGWVVPDTEWLGVRVGTLLEMAGPLPDARYVVFKSGEYSECFPLSEIGDMVVAYKHRGEVLAHEHGGPLRLVFPRQHCYQSIKWLEEIELTSRYVEGTARGIALKRIRNDISPR